MVDAEQAVLGACLIDATAYWKVSDLLVADDFAKGAHRQLWAVIGQLAREGGAIDFITVGEHSAPLGELAMHLAATQASAANVRAYGEAVARHAMERRVATAGQRIAALRGADALSEARRILAECAPTNLSTVRWAKDVLKQSMNELIQRHARGEHVDTGLPTGLPWLDEITGGLQGGDLIVLGARPSAGKTALAMQIVEHVSFLEATPPALVFSAEMSDTQVIERMVASNSRVTVKALRRPAIICEEGWTSITTASARLRDANLLIDGSAGITVDAICARARQVKEQHGLSMIAIDYLQLLKLPKADRHDLAVGEASKAFKGLAKSLNVPVIALSQLNREGANVRPTVDKLRQSGDIEQDADLILLLYRPDDDKPQRELILAKQRNGETGSCWLDYDGPRFRFAEGEAPEMPQAPKTKGFDHKAKRAGCP